MRIRTIRFKNINSFYGTDTLDFTHGLLEQTGLFVIAGATGAGKSTLLDVMTLALFNRVPRIVEADGRALSKDRILAEGLLINHQASYEPKAEAFAEIEYEIGQKAFRSRWSIAKNRNLNWNDYEMELAALPDEKIISSRKSEIPTLNTEQIGLSYDQFIRSIVLAQGAFDKFLKASGNDRSKLLEQITGTDIYRRIGQKAYERNRDYQAQLTLKRNQIGFINTLTPDELQAVETQQTQIEAEQQHLTEQLGFYRTEAATADRIAETSRQLETLTHQLADWQQLEQQAAPQADRLKRHRQVADLADLLAQLTQYEKTIEQAEQNRQQAQLAEHTYRQQADALRQEIKTLIQKPQLADDALPAAFAAFRDAVLSLDNELVFSKQAAQQQQERIVALLRQQPGRWTAADAQNPEALAEAVSVRQQAVSQTLLAVADTYNPNNPIRTELDQLVEQLSLLDSLMREQEAETNLKTQQQSLEQTYSQTQQQLQTSKPIAGRLAAHIATLEQEIGVLENEKIRLAQEAQFDELRKSLADGEPCPLCGSPDHPYARHFINQVGTVETNLLLKTNELKQTKLEFDVHQKTILEAESNLRVLHQNQQRIAQQTQTLTAHIAAQLAALPLPAAQQPLPAYRQTLVEKRSQLQRIEQLQTEQQWLDQLAIETQTALIHQTKRHQLQRQRARLYNGTAIQDHYNRQTERLQQLQTHIGTQAQLAQQAEQQTQTARIGLKKLYENLNPVLQSRGLADAQTAKTYLLSAPDLQTAERQQRDLYEQKQRLEGAQKQAETQRQTLHANRQTAMTQPEINHQLHTLEAQSRSLTEQLGNLKEKLSAARQEQHRKGILLDELRALESEAEPWAEINALIGSANGDVFSRFAQSLTLQHLIALANRRLIDLTDRYRLLKPREGQSELYVVDFYQGNAERTVASLSGGETFTLSLGLALALSDLASQNVQIDSLFIDEGFGTLDPDALDVAIAMLEKIQQNGHKTIGIISHRPEIRERISVQVLVEKGHDGNSRLRIAEL